MHTMLIRPSRDELEAFGRPAAVIFNAGQFPANRHTTGMTSKTSIELDLEHRELVILGTEYAGEMKKGVFTMRNYVMPQRGVLSIHGSATADTATGRSSVLFGLSGTGKTCGAVLSAPRRGSPLHGDAGGGRAAAERAAVVARVPSTMPGTPMRVGRIQGSTPSAPANE